MDVCRMAFRESDLTRIRCLIEECDQRIAAQETLIERLSAGGHSTEQAENFLRTMLDLRAFQIQLRKDVERLLKIQNSST